MQKLINGQVVECVTLVDPTTGSTYAFGADREIATVLYIAKNAFSGASVGDSITSTQIIEVYPTASTISVIWRNQTTGVDLISAPLAANLTLVGGSALTNAELRSTAVSVSVASLPLPSTASTSALQTDGNNTLLAISGKLPALNGSRLPAITTIPTCTSASILSLTTSATGTSYVTFASSACAAVDIVNNSGTTIEYQRGGTGSAIPIPTASSRLVIGITNANQIGVRRLDNSGTQVTVTAEALVL